MVEKVKIFPIEKGRWAAYKNGKRASPSFGEQREVVAWAERRGLEYEKGGESMVSRRYGKPRTDEERRARHKELTGKDELPPRGTGLKEGRGARGTREEEEEKSSSESSSHPLNDVITEMIEKAKVPEPSKAEAEAAMRKYAHGVCSFLGLPDEECVDESTYWWVHLRESFKAKKIE